MASEESRITRQSVTAFQLLSAFLRDPVSFSFTATISAAILFPGVSCLLWTLLLYRLPRPEKSRNTTFRIFSRVLIAYIGISWGQRSYMPNMLVMGSGANPDRMRAAHIGTSASYVSALGGFIGAAVSAPWAGWRALIPGLVLQCWAFKLRHYL